MAGGLLHVALDVDYADDEAIIIAGEKAELLYVRALCTAKKMLSDGFVADAQITRYGLSGWQARARRLVEVGLWRRDPARAGYWILGWLKHNEPADQVHTKSAAKREAGAKANHKRWHTDRGEWEPTCRFCHEADPNGSHNGSEPDPTSDPTGSQGSSPSVGKGREGIGREGLGREGRSSSSSSGQPKDARRDDEDDVPTHVEPQPHGDPADAPVPPANPTPVTVAAALNGTSLRAWLHGTDQRDGTTPRRWTEQSLRALAELAVASSLPADSWPPYAGQILAEHLAEVRRRDTPAADVDTLRRLCREHPAQNVLDQLEVALVDPKVRSHVSYAKRCLTSKGAK